MPEEMAIMKEEIRLFNYEQDIQSIKDVWQKNATDEQKWESVDSEIRCAKNKTYVKVRNDSIVAFIVIRSEDIVCADNQQNYIFELCVYPKRQGFGSELIKKMQAERLLLKLHVKKSNYDAIRCYEKNGFEIKGENSDGSKHRMVWENKNCIKSDG